MKTIRRFVSAATACLMIGSLLTAMPEGSLKASAIRGEGTKEMPYYVQSYDELESLLDTKRHGNGEGEIYIQLINDIKSEDSNNDINFYMDSSFDHTIHLDLAGHILSRTARTTDESMFLLGSNATLIIDDSTGGGKIICAINSSNKIESMFNVTGSGTLIINDGKFLCMGEDDKTNYIIHDQGGKTIINGGTFYSAYTLVDHESGNIRFAGGTFFQETNPKNVAAWDIKGSYVAYECTVVGRNEDITLEFANDGYTGSLRDSSAMGVYTNLKINGEWINTYTMSYPITGRKIDFESYTVDSLTMSVTPPIEDNYYSAPTIYTEKMKIYSYYWTDMKTGNKLTSSDTFIAGRQYKLTAGVSADTSKNVVLYKTPEVLINNKTPDEVKVSSSTENLVECSYVFTASEKEITNVDLSVTEPWDGALPDVPAVEHDNVSMTGYKWYEEDGTTPMKADEKFVGGKKYVLKMDLTPLNACTFNNKVRAHLNGEDITVDHISPTSITAWRSYIAVDPVLTEARLTVTAPLDGEKPARPNPYEWSNIDKRLNYQWFLLGEDGSTTYLMDKNEVFKSGETYILDVAVYPTEGYKFSPDIKGYVNDMEGVISDSNDKYMQFRVKFENIDPVLGDINFKITAPKGGAAHETEAECLEPNAYIGMIVNTPRNGKQFKSGIFTWIDTESGEELRAAGQEFEEGKTYTAVLTVFAKKGYRIDKNTKVYVNGKEAHTDTEVFTDGVGVKYTVDFVATAEGEDDSSSKPDSSSTDKPTFKKGDVNADGKIDIEDAVKVINHVNGQKALTADETERANVDSNSKVDIEDAVSIIAHVNGVKKIN